MKKGKKLIALALTLSALTYSLSGCNQDAEIPYTLDEVLASFAEETNLDELMTVGENIQIIISEESKEKDFMESVNKLEEYIALSNDLAAIGIKPAETSTVLTAEKYANLDIEDVKLLIETLQENTITDVEKARITAGLSYVLTQNKEWISTNGLNISEELLKRVVKASACEASGLEIEYYTSCKIGARKYSKESSAIGEIEVIDPISNATLTYQIANDNGALTTACEVLYNIQALETDESYETIVSYCSQALDTAKIAIAAGVELDGSTIKSETKINEAKKLILQKNAPEQTETNEG